MGRATHGRAIELKQRLLRCSQRELSLDRRDCYAIPKTGHRLRLCASRSSGCTRPVVIRHRTMAWKCPVAPEQKATDLDRAVAGFPATGSHILGWWRMAFSRVIKEHFNHCVL